MRQVFLNKGMVLAKDISYIDCIKKTNGRLSTKNHCPPRGNDTDIN
jgi:hypothetical protein